MRRVPVLPLNGKIPLLRNGLHGASHDPIVVRSWWARWPDANIGVPTGARFWVLDIDPGADLVAFLGDNRLPDTRHVLTPRGRHIYFAPDDRIRNSAGKFAPGIDVRAKGGFVVAPPSIGPDGTLYRWANSSPIRPAPTWLIALLLPPKPPPRATVCSPKKIQAYVEAAVYNELTGLEGAREGNRNDRLNKSAFALGGFVKSQLLPEDWTAQQLENRAVALGLSLTEAHKTVRSAFAAASPRVVPQ